jgi:O-antigen/teichoic acid export membrane protein
LRWIAQARSGTAAVVQSIFARFAILAVNVLTGVITARVLLPQGRGESTAMCAWAAGISTAFAMGIPTAYTYFARREPEARRELFSAAAVACVCSGVLAGLVGVAIIPHLMRQYDKSVVQFAQLMMVFGPQMILLYLLQQALDARSQFSDSNRLRYLAPSATLVLLLVLAFFHVLVPRTSALAYFLPMVAVTIIALYQLRDMFPLRFAAFYPSLRKLYGYGLRIYPLDLLNQFALMIDQVIVIGFLSAAQLGIYSAALSASRMINVFPLALNTVLFPKAAGLSDADIANLAGRSARITTGLSAVGGIVMILAVPIILPLLYGRAFSAAAPITRVLIVEAVLSGPASVLTQAFIASGRATTASIFQIVALSFSIPLLLILVPRFGLMGAAVAILASTIARLLMISFSYPLILKRRIPNLLMTLSDLRYLRGALSLGHRGT